MAHTYDIVLDYVVAPGKRNSTNLNNLRFGMPVSVGEELEVIIQDGVPQSVTTVLPLAVSLGIVERVVHAMTYRGEWPTETPELNHSSSTLYVKQQGEEPSPALLHIIPKCQETYNR